MPTILVTDYDFPDLEIERSAFAGVADLVAAQADSPTSVIEAAEGVDPDVLLVQYAEISAAVIDALDGLDLVAVYGIGTDNVDVVAAADRGVTVVNVPNYCADEVAEHALGLILACERNVARFDTAVNAGEWDWTRGRPMTRIRGKTLGIVGYGRIGRTLAGKTAGLGLDHLVYDPYVDDDELGPGTIERVGFDALLRRSDIVSVHVPLTDETRGLFDAAAFGRMKTDAVFINTARGPVADIDALAEAVTAGSIRAAGLDVLPEEPPGDLPLRDLESVVLTPHVAWYSEESIRDLRETVSADIVRVLGGEPPANPVDPDGGPA